VAWLVASIVLYVIFFACFGEETYLAWFWLVELLRWGIFW
jgi:hypothetical protein